MGTAQEQANAKAILPIRKRGNLLLCTLLIGNTVTNSFLSIFMADLTSGIVGLVVSTALIVILGEITPQSVCTRHGLLVGAKTIYITQFFMIIFYPVTWPISKVLDWALGVEVGNVYNRKALKRLIELHAEHTPHQSGLTHDDRNILTGALEYSYKKVSEVMTNLDAVFMLEASTKLSFDTLLEIYKTGYTRIPIYEKDRQCVLGLLYVKDLILVDPDDEMEVRTIIAFNGRAHMRFIPDSTPLNEVMNLFKQSQIHLMFAVRMKTIPEKGVIVHADSMHKLISSMEPAGVEPGNRFITGIITLEDVLEEVINAEIVDEHDNFVSNSQGSARVVHHVDRDPSKYLSLFSHKIREASKLSTHEVNAVAAYTTANVPEFIAFKGAETIVQGIVRSALVVDIEEPPTQDQALQEKERLPTEIGSVVNHKMLLYKRGVQSDMFSLILQGDFVVHVGQENFESELGPWSYLGSSALLQSKVYVPDYTAYAIGPCRLIRIHKNEYLAALKAAQIMSVVRPRVTRMATLGRDSMNSGGQDDKLGDQHRDGDSSAPPSPTRPRETSSVDHQVDIDDLQHRSSRRRGSEDDLERGLGELETYGSAGRRD